jgi:flavin reductase (DIM6/NTAB) family NADH-FMN oxidoreductase RutF
MTKISLKPGTYLYPLPAALITCGPRERPNIVTLAWMGTLCSEPPILGISIRPSRHSSALIKQHGEFVVNLPTAELARATDYCGVVSGQKVDKFAATGLTPAAAKVVHTVVIAECPVNIECQVAQVLSLGSHDLFLGQVVAVQADQSVLGDKGEIDLNKAHPLVYGGNRYWNLGQLLATHGFSAKD